MMGFYLLPGLVILVLFLVLEVSDYDNNVFN